MSGLSIPEELSIVGFDDIPFASYVHPPLTTIAQPISQMGWQAVKMVLALIGESKEETGWVSNVIVQGRLIVRGSSGARRDQNILSGGISS